LGALVGDPQLRLATEAEFADAFPECELGAIPPIGELFGVPLWVDDSLGREAETVFSAGTHHETVHLAYRDFVRLAKPTFGAFSTRAAVKSHWRDTLAPRRIGTLEAPRRPGPAIRDER